MLRAARPSLTLFLPFYCFFLSRVPDVSKIILVAFFKQKPTQERGFLHFADRADKPNSVPPAGGRQSFIWDVDYSTPRAAPR